MIDIKLKIKDRRIGKFEKDNKAVRLNSNIFEIDHPEFPFFFFLSEIQHNQY